MLAIGDTLQNRYRVVRQLGHGGMGTVYEAHDERFENAVALKEVLIDLAKIADPVQQQMVSRAFEREAKTLALLHHEAFPHVIDYFSERDHQYLIMELIRGEDLGEQLQARKKPFEFEEVLEWTKQLLDALDYLHTQEQPIIHRDLKPQNMKITERGKVKVLDFGIAKGADNKSTSTITNQTFVAATLNYSPIEQLLRVLDPTFREFISQRHKDKVEDILEHTADARSDLYSLGATLYQLLTATQPHDTLKRALDIWAGKPDPLPSPMELNPQIPPRFNQLLLKSMQIDRDSRFVSAAEMQEAVREFLKNESQTQDRANQAAWLAEHQKGQSPAAPQSELQTQMQISEPPGFQTPPSQHTPNIVKLETASSINQPPVTAPSPAAPPAPQAHQFVQPQADYEEERRRIAEQQRFLAELDAPVNEAASPQFVQPQQPNYPPPIEQSADRTQVSYLENILPPAQTDANATVMNPPIPQQQQPAAFRHEPAPAAMPVAQPPTVLTEAPKNSKSWLLPVAGVGLLALLAAIGGLAWAFLPASQPISNTNTVKPSVSPSEAPAVANTGGTANSAVAEKPSVASDKTPPATAGGAANPAQKPDVTTAKREIEPAREKNVVAEKPAARVADAPKPQAPAKPAAKPAGKQGGQKEIRVEDL